MIMDKNKLHLIACYTASLCVDENYTRCKEASDTGTTDDLLTDSTIKRSLILASIPVVKDSEVIKAVKEDVYFRTSFKQQIAALVASTKFYN